MKSGRLYLLLTAIALTLMPLARPAMAVTKTPLTFLTTATVVDPGTQWVTRNTLHVRGEVFSGIVSGDLTGTSMTVVSTELNVNNPAVGFTGIQIRAKFTLTTATVTWA